PYDHKSGRITTEQEASASGSLKARNDRKQPAEVTMPRASPATSETAEVARPDLDDGPKAGDELPRAADVHDPTAPTNAPRPISVPPAAPPIERAHVSPERAASNATNGGVDERFAIANLPSFDDEPAMTASDSGVDAKPAGRSKNPFATPAVQAPGHVAPIAVEAPLAPPPSPSSKVPHASETSSPFSVPRGDLGGSDAVVEIPIVRAGVASSTTATSARADLVASLPRGRDGGASPPAAAPA